MMVMEIARLFEAEDRLKQFECTAPSKQDEVTDLGF